MWEKKLNLGLIDLKVDLKVGIDCWGGRTGWWGWGRFSWIEEARETRGSFRLLRRRPVMPMSRVDSRDGFVFNELIVRIIDVSYSWSNISNDKKIL